MSDLEKEKEKLWNEVLGKRRPYDVPSEQTLKDPDDARDQLNGILKNMDEMQAELKKDYGVKEKADIKAVFDEAEGVIDKKVKGENEAVRDLLDAFHRPFVTGKEKGTPSGVILVSGPEGCGRHSALVAVARYLHEKDVFSSAEVYSVDLSRYTDSLHEQIFLQDMYEAFSSSSSVICFENAERCFPSFIRSLCELCTSGEMVLKKRYVLTKGILVENQTGLVQKSVDSLHADGKYLVFIRDQKQKSFQDVFGADFLKHVLADIQFQPLDEETLKEILEERCDNLREKCRHQLHIEIEITAETKDWIAADYDKEKGAEGIETILAEFYLSIGSAVMHEEEAGRGRLVVEDNLPYILIGQNKYLLKKTDNSEREIEQVNQELDQIVGLDNVKKYIRSLQAAEMVNLRRKKQGLKTASVSKHMIFTGNPGTGKTTVARLLARYMKAIGVLSEGQLVEVTRADLVARYVGQTAPLTRSVIKSALGGVLFIDEAYSLYRGKDDSFGLEAIDTLVKAMEDYRDDLIVILAGYKKEMESFLDANSGLASRFPNQIEFPDYSGSELLRIADLQAEGKGYRLDEEVKKPLEAYFTKIQEEKAAEAGNGRLARNVIEKAILHQSERIMQDENADLSLLKREDFDTL